MDTITIGGLCQEEFIKFMAQTKMAMEFNLIFLQEMTCHQIYQPILRRALLMMVVWDKEIAKLIFIK